MSNNNLTACAFSEASRYQAMKNRLFLLNILLNFLFLLLLVSFGFSRQIKAWAIQWQCDLFYVNALYFSVFSILGFCLSFPLEYYEGFLLERRYQLSKQGFFAWFKDVLKKSCIVFVVSLILVEAVYFFLFKSPEDWWVWASFFWFFISIVLTRIFPKVILPLFFRSKPLETGILRDKIFALLNKFKIAVKDIYVLDFSKKTVKANAMVAGMGATKQIFLSDTLVEEFPAGEVEAVLAHELGHYMRHDTVKLVFAGLVGAFISFYAAATALKYLVPFFGFSALSDIAGLPLLLAVLLLVSLVLLPLQNGFSRFIEKKADIFALKVTGDPAAFISMMQRLGERNLSEFSPSKIIEFFLYDHPPIAKRIEMAKGFKNGA
ncbi:MAG: M48 family metallopeptidase [Candidatus Omnitrophica bacterium]|nr:M48 family metallopeptidase [Candidatus Omnitrophota bacterium]